MWPFKRRRRGPTDPLDLPLLHWSADASFTLRDLCSHVIIVGETGSAKSTGALVNLVKAAIQSDCAILFNTNKVDDSDQYEKWCLDCEETPIRFGPGGKWRFDPMNYETKDRRVGVTAATTAKLLETLMEVSGRGNASGSGENSFFFDYASLAITTAIDMQLLADGEATLRGTELILDSSPCDQDEARSDAWKQSSPCAQAMARMVNRNLNESQTADAMNVFSFFMKSWPDLGNRVRSNVLATCKPTFRQLLARPFGELLSSGSNFTPEELYSAGKCVIVDTPIKRWHEGGVLLNTLMRCMTTRIVERRSVKEFPRVVCCVVDEAQLTVNKQDVLAMSTGRSARLAMILCTQTISSLYSAFGGDAKGQHDAESLLSNAGTKIFLNSSNPATCEYAASLAQKRHFEFESGGYSESRNSDVDEQPQGNINSGWSQNEAWELHPAMLQKLKRGGPPDYECEAIVFRAAPFPNGRNWLKVTFQQDLT